MRTSEPSRPVRSARSLAMTSLGAVALALLVAGASLAALPATPAGPGPWVLTKVDDGGAFVQSGGDFGLDADGRVRLLMELPPQSVPGARMFAVTLDGAAPAAPSFLARGSLSHLAVAPSGALHVCHRAVPGPGLAYTQVVGASVTSTTIVAEAPAGCRIALDAQGNLHVAFTTSAGALSYASRAAAGGAWSIESVGSGAAPHAALALGPDGAPQVLWTKAASQALHRSARLPGGWSDAVVDAGASEPDLRVDAAGRAHAVYVRSGGEVWYALGGAAGWAKERIEGPVHGDPAIALSPAGAPHVVYIAQSFGAQGGQVSHATKEGGAWSRTRVHEYEGLSVHADVEVDVAGVPHLTFLQSHIDPDLGIVDQDVFHGMRLTERVAWTAR